MSNIKRHLKIVKTGLYLPAAGRDQLLTDLNRVTENVIARSESDEAIS